MTYHYWTQPLPHSASWFFHQLPYLIQQFSALATLIIELPVPLLLLAPHPTPRLIGFGLISPLMFLIIATGNYGFFNWLTTALCCSVLSDSHLSYVMAPSPFPSSPWSPWLSLLMALPAAAVAMPLAAAVAMPIVDAPRMSLSYEPPRFAVMAKAWLRPLGVGSSYGLFARMTTFRHDQLLES